MLEEKKVLGLIPARGGSKGLPGKNMAQLRGRPLIAHTIEAARQSRLLSRVIVSTDDAQIAETALGLGAEVPFLRPPELAEDDTPALPVIRHAMGFLDDKGWRPDIVVYLQPTSPLRRARHIDQAVELLFSREADSVVSVVEVPHNFNPLSILKTNDQGILESYDPQGNHVLRRQDKPHFWARNGPAVLVATRNTIMRLKTLYGPKTIPLIMDQWESFDIDSQNDLDLVEWVLSRRKN